MTMSEPTATPDYEYNLQYKWRDEWRFFSTNRFSRDTWYPSRASAKNALAQMRATRWGRPAEYEYRLVRRPVGEWEVVDES